jgi:quercetin dioxygenase-like cupin family protein
MDIKRSGSQASGKGPAGWFTGTVRIDPLFQVNDPARTSGASVTFEPGARTIWHPPAGPDPDRDGWLRLDAALGRPGGGNPAG